MTRTRIFLPLSIVVLVALLAGLIFWRMDDSLARSAWVELASGSPAKISAAEKAVSQAELAISKTRSSSRKADLNAKAKNVKNLIAQTETIGQYLEVTKEAAESSPNAKLDPLSLSQSGDTDSFSVAVPSDFRLLEEEYRGILDSLDSAARELADSTD